MNKTCKVGLFILSNAAVGYAAYKIGQIAGLVEAIKIAMNFVGTKEKHENDFGTNEKQDRFSL